MIFPAIKLFTFIVLCLYFKLSLAFLLYFAFWEGIIEFLLLRRFLGYYRMLGFDLIFLKFCTYVFSHVITTKIHSIEEIK